MAFKFLDTHDVFEALQQQEDTARQRFQHLCDQMHEVLRRLPEPDPAAADLPAASAAASVAEAAVAQPPAPAPAEEPAAEVVPAEELRPEQPLPEVSQALGRRFVPKDWARTVLGSQLADDPALAAPCQTLLAGLAEGQQRAMTLAGQVLLFRAAAPERYPQLLKDLGEAYYGWCTVYPDDGRFEAALVAWLSETCAAGGVGNVIERVQPGDRFDPVRHQAPQPGAEVAEVHGWVVLRDNGKVYTRAAVTAR